MFRSPTLSCCSWLAPWESLALHGGVVDFSDLQGSTLWARGTWLDRRFLSVKPRSQFPGFTLPNWVPPLGPLLDSLLGGRATLFCFWFWLKFCQVFEPSR